MSHPAGGTGVQRNITRRRRRQSRRVFLQGLAAGGGEPIEQMSPRGARAVLADLQSSVKADLPSADVAELHTLPIVGVTFTA